MKVAYAARAVAGLSEIGIQSRKAFGNAVAAALETLHSRNGRADRGDAGEWSTSARASGGAGGPFDLISVQDFLYGSSGRRSRFSEAP
jgi:hypothetical protein